LFFFDTYQICAIDFLLDALDLYSYSIQSYICVSQSQLTPSLYLKSLYSYAIGKFGEYGEKCGVSIDLDMYLKVIWFLKQKMVSWWYDQVFLSPVEYKYRYAQEESGYISILKGKFRNMEKKWDGPVRMVTPKKYRVAPVSVFSGIDRSVGQ